MKKTNQFLAVTGVALTLAFSAANVLAQGGFGGGAGGGGGGGRGFDMTQVVPMMVEGMRQSLAVTNDDEWNVIEPKLEKVVKLKMEERTTGITSMGGMFGGRGGGAGGMARLNPLTGAPDPSVDVLQKAIDSNAPIAEVKAAMAKVRDARLQKRAALLKAQQDLKDVLSIRQEATLLLMGQLD